MNKKTLLGIILIACGLGTLLSRFGILTGSYPLLIISGCFFVAYFMYGSRGKGYNGGFLIPACILLAIGTYSIIDDNILENVSYLENIDGAIFFFFLGAGFFLIYIIHNITNHVTEGKRWSRTTAFWIWAFGAFILLCEYLDEFKKMEISKYVIPLALIVIGAYFLISPITRKKDL